MSSRTQKVALTFLIIPAFAAIWGGWVGLGRLSGFGPVALLPGIWDGLVVDLSITLPVSVEAYAALALGIWLGRIGSPSAQRFARISALMAMVLGGLGQVSYHLLTAAGATAAPTPVVILVSILPVLTLTAAAALLHLLPEQEKPAVEMEATQEVEEEQPSAPEIIEPEHSVEVVEVHRPEPAPQPLRPVSTATSGGTKREEVEAILRADPTTPASQIATRVGCSARYARDIRSQLTEGEAA